MSALPSAKLYPTLGSNIVVLRSDSVFKTTQEGLASQTLSVFGSYTDLINGGPWTTSGSALTISRARNSANPYYSSLLLYSSSIKNMTGGQGQCTLEYRGLDPSYSGSPPGPIYSLDRSTSNEAIQTHIKWVSAIGGTPSSPLNGAQYRSVNPGGTGYSYNPGTNISSNSPDANFNPNVAQFNGWLYINSGSAISIFAGTTDYLLAGQTWTATYVDTSAPSSSDTDGVGFIATPDGSPPTPSGFQWIYLGCRYTNQAGVFRVDKSWRMFKTNAASTIIYTA